MSSDYSTIQGHEPLRVPQGWQKQERAFVVQLEEILDDIYRRFGRLRVQDLGSDLKKIVEDVDGLSYAQYEIDVEGIRTEVGKKVDQTTLAQYSTTQQTATQISTYVQNSLSDYSTTSQTATQIQTKINNSLQDYSTTSQTATQISTYVTNNAYNKVSGITINSDGVDISGSKTVTIAADTNKWAFSSNGLEYWQNGQSSFRIDTKTQEAYSGWAGLHDLMQAYDSSIGKYRQHTIVLHSTYWTSNAIQMRSLLFGVNDINGYRGILRPNTTGFYLGNSSYPWYYGYFTNLIYTNITQSSSRTYKHDIKDIEDCGDRLDKLNPVSFVYNDDPDETQQTGLIYEDTVDVMPEICRVSDDGRMAISIVSLVPMLLKEIQSLRKRVAALENKE